MELKIGNTEHWLEFDADGVCEDLVDYRTFTMWAEGRNPIDAGRCGGYYNNDHAYMDYDVYGKVVRQVCPNWVKTGWLELRP